MSQSKLTVKQQNAGAGNSAQPIAEHVAATTTGTTTATVRWSKAIVGKVASGRTHGQAASELIREQPQLHLDYLAESNRNRPRVLNEISRSYR